MKIRNPILNRIFVWSVAKSLRLLAKTLRYRLHEETPGTCPINPDVQDGLIYALWHDQTLMPIFYRVGIKRPHTGLPTRALVSKHQDGSYLTDLMNEFDLGAIRGSSSKGGAAAVKQLLETSDKGHIVITPDGPRGPRHQVKAGVVYLASQTGLPIAVNANAVSRFWNVQGSWTNQIIPKPFSTVHLLVAKPIHVPPDISREEMEVYQRRIEAELERLQKLADQILSGEISELPKDDALGKIANKAA